MDYDTIIYNVKIYSLADRKSVYKTMFTKIGFVTALFEEATPDEDINIKQVVEVKDARRMIMFPPFVHYTEDLGFDITMYSSLFNCSGYLKDGANHISKADFYAALSKTAADGNVKEPYIIYNFDRDAISSCEIPSKEELDSLFKGKSYALFDKSNEYCIVSDKVLKNMGKEFENHSAVFEGGDYISFREVILKTLITMRPNILTSGVFAYLREAKRFGIKAFVTSADNRLNRFTAEHINSNYAIKAYIAKAPVDEDIADIFPDAVSGSMNPFERLNELTEGNMNGNLFKMLKLYSGREFGISDIAGEIKKGTSSDYILLVTDIFEAGGDSLKTCEVKELVIGGKEPVLDNSLTIYLKMFRSLGKLK